VFAGLIAIETRAEEVTKRLVVPITDPELAEMLTLPRPWAVATDALMVATLESDVDHDTCPVIACVLLSLNVPMAL